MTETTRETELRALLSETSNRDLSDMRLEADLVEELSLDSLGALRMLALVEKRFGVRFPDGRLAEFRSLQRLLDVIEEGTEGGVS